MIVPYRSEITVAQLFEAYYDCRKRKRNTVSALEFEVELEGNLMTLFGELRSGSWEPSPASVFVVKRPKPREVWAAAFRDRIVHHLVYRAVGPLFERAFIHDTCASIKGRGTLYAADRLYAHLRSATQTWSVPAFYLKADIANFFGSIDQGILFDKLTRRIRDTTMLDLCRKLVFQDVRRDAVIRCSDADLRLVAPHKSLFRGRQGVGLPIGNLSSQFFANVYLDGLDQMVKRKLRFPHYVRYVDDFVIIDPSPKTLLAAADAIRDHLGADGMRLAESKTYVAPVEKGVDFVGHVMRPWRRSARAGVHRNALKRLETVPAAELPTQTNSYLGLYKHVGNRAQITQIARIAHRRGLRLDRELTRVISTRNIDAPVPT
jgi:RNA-directed DNA polymerase